MLAVTIASERLVHKVPKNPQTQGRRQSGSKLQAHTHPRPHSPKATNPMQPNGSQQTQLSPEIPLRT